MFHSNLVRLHLSLMLCSVDRSHLNPSTHDLNQPLTSVDIVTLQRQVQRAVPSDSNKAHFTLSLAYLTQTLQTTKISPDQEKAQDF